MPKLGSHRVLAVFRRAPLLVWRRVRRNWWLDRTCIIFLVTIGIVFGLSYYFMNVMANVASKRSKLIEDALGTRYTLPDVFFEFIGAVELLWMTDMFDALMFVPTALLVAWHERPWRVVSRLLLAWGLASLIRITTVAITSVPDPRPSCQYVEGNVFTAFTLHRCGDAIYSGHTLIFVVCAMVWTSFAPKNIVGRVLTTCAWALCVAGSLIVIANRAHYTIDVLLAWYIAPGAWYTVAWFWYWQVTKKGRLLRIEFPVEVGRHRDADSREMCQRRRVQLGLTSDGVPYDPVAMYLNALQDSEMTPPRQSVEFGEKGGSAESSDLLELPDSSCAVDVGVGNLSRDHVLP
ncbi:hypothetical protein IW139_001598 [Coemansia sp. RSA 353]|nr:hypothetical protein LPJ62_003348 [Coemansia sp. RSA 2167]KAJ2229326.1 hypothetical protein EV180_001552 [Coemansia sp. RSA 518]KAJ2250366.1 hypothetical protein GGH97_000765 [Coemansia sp. RSA 475]KAJ2278612.1 hypothetical protein J3F81_000385 [Coemansia sp. RSA 371]KAJ2282776.1 hypothetical protein GGH14_001351 [Coemansia sp. RSA 370]KAJ2290475.1 hypothetical protein IW141_003253 [Coemansia sp. RSA 355]KAJ2299643.1 hypothetical protein IW139_001598 [Coemansia sp. RSA 353]